MLKMISLVCFMLVAGLVKAQYEPMRKIEVKISEWQTRQALIYTPTPTVAGERFPLLIAFHGRSVAGKDLAVIYKDGVPRQLKEGKLIEAVNPADGKLYKFILLAPMAQSWSFAPQDVGMMLDDVIRRYPVDTTRIYLSGYSAGGWSVEAAKTHSPELAARIAACITMSPANLDPDYLKRFKQVADADIHTWYFVGTKDDYFRQNVKSFMDSTAKYKQGLTKLTMYPGAHCCWSSFFTPKYRENGKNIYEWLLQYKKTYAVKPRKK